MLLFKYFISCKTNWMVVLFLTIIIVIACDPQTDKVVQRDSRNLNRSSLTDLQKGDSFFKKSLYDSAYLYYKLAAGRFEKTGKTDDLTALLLKITDVHRFNGNQAEAFSSIVKAESLLDTTNPKDLFRLAEIQHKRALLLLDKGEFDSAINVINKGIRTKIRLKGVADTSLAMNYNGLGTAYFYKNDFNNALKYYNLAYNIALKRKEPEDADLAMFVQNIGIMNATMGDYEAAESSFIKSLSINEKLLDKDDPELAMINLNVGRLKALLNKDADALALYNKAEKIISANAQPDHPYYVYVYINKGQTYIHIADYEKALLYFNRALALAKKTFDLKHPQVLSINMNIGYVYEKKNEYSNALRYYLASLSAEDNPSVVKTYTNLASLYNKLEDKEKADHYYKKALALSEKYFGNDHPETGLLYTKYGYFLLLNDLNGNKLSFFNKALEISRKLYGEKSRETSNNYTHIGNYFYVNDNLASALEYYQKALIALIPNFESTDIYTNPEFSLLDADRYLVNTLNGKADALAEMGTLKSTEYSLETLILSLKVIDKLRTTYQDEDSKLLVSEDAKATFQKTVKIATRLYQKTNDKKYLEEAFTYSDKSKSAVLINSIRDIEAQQFGNIPDHILKLEKDLRLNVSNFKRFIYEEQQKASPDNGKISAWETKLFQYSVRNDSLTEILEKQYPEYYTLKYSEPSIDIKTVQNSLENDRLLVEYMIGDSSLYIFAINNKSFEIFVQAIDSGFYKDIQNIVLSTNNSSIFSASEEDFIKYATSAYKLYNTLITPFRSKFTEKKIIIIPDAEIGYISFDMLLTSMPDLEAMDYRELAYLIRENVISYSTSALLQFSNFRNRERKPTRNFLAMAPSYENLTDTKKNFFMDENNNKVYLLPIPGVEKEMQGIPNNLFARKIKDKEATEERFKQEVGKYNVLHLAMHTLVNNNEPMLSKLVFYQDSDTIEDGMLNTYELFSIELNAGLAVLSACNTGSGKLLKGEGIMSLARGFIFAGVPGIVMTMWSVDDESSANIVIRFYDYLEDGMPKDEALRQAKLDLLAEGDPLKSHPYYWAAYVNIGDNSPMKFRNTLLYYSVIGGVAMFLPLLFFVYKRRKKHLNQ